MADKKQGQPQGQPVQKTQGGAETSQPREKRMEQAGEELARRRAEHQEEAQKEEKARHDAGVAEDAQRARIAERREAGVAHQAHQKLKEEQAEKEGRPTPAGSQAGGERPRSAEANEALGHVNALENLLQGADVQQMGAVDWSTLLLTLGRLLKALLDKLLPETREAVRTAGHDSHCADLGEQACRIACMNQQAACLAMQMHHELCCEKK